MSQSSSSDLTRNSMTSFSQKSDEPNTISQEQAIAERYNLKLIGENSSEDEESYDRSDVYTILKKQLISSKRELKRCGIISGIAMVIEIAITSEHQNEVQLSDSTRLTFSDLNGTAHEAACLLEMIKTATGDIPELLGLFYDQLTAIISKTENLDRHFIAWLYDTITNDFEEIFVTENVCEDINDLLFSKQFNLLKDEDLEAPIAVNIGELTLRSEKRRILILAPIFRLLRLLHYIQHNGDLSSIDALLGCGVILPKMGGWSSLDSDRLQQIADCLFHCINWFREIINGFVTQESIRLRVLVMQRLDNLILLERLLGECLAKIPRYELPTSYFDSSSSSQSTCSDVNSLQKEPTTDPKDETVEDEDTTVASTSRKQSKRVVEERRVAFREMDKDLLNLLKYDLTFKYLEPTRDGICLNISRLNFILKDFVTKLTLLTKGWDLGLSHLNELKQLDLMRDCVLILPNINKHFSTIVDRFKQSDKYSLIYSELQTCFGLVLETLALIFKWPGFENSKNFNLLNDILRAFRDKNSPHISYELYSYNSFHHLVAQLVTRLTKLHQNCVRLSHVLYLIKTVEALYALSPSNTMRNKIAATSGTLLKKRWNGDSVGKDMDLLIKWYLRSATIGKLYYLAKELQNQVKDLRGKEDTLQMLPIVDKINLYILYRNFWICLHDRIKTQIKSLTKKEHLTIWKEVALIMQDLTTIVRTHENESNLEYLMKESLAILNIFLSHGLPVLKIKFKSKPHQVVEIFKTFRSNNHFLHQLCCYFKLIKSPTLITYVPQIRLALKTIMYRVKALLVANDCTEAFFMGNLKNCDLQGADILTQSTLEDNEYTSSSSSTFTTEDEEDILLQSTENSTVEENEDTSSSSFTFTTDDEERERE